MASPVGCELPWKRWMAFSDPAWLTQFSSRAHGLQPGRRCFQLADARAHSLTPPKASPPGAFCYYLSFTHISIFFFLVQERERKEITLTTSYSILLAFILSQCFNTPPRRSFCKVTVNVPWQTPACCRYPGLTTQLGILRIFTTFPKRKSTLGTFWNSEALFGLLCWVREEFCLRESSVSQSALVGLHVCARRSEPSRDCSPPRHWKPEPEVSPMSLSSWSLN